MNEIIVILDEISIEIEAKAISKLDYYKLILKKDVEQQYLYTRSKRALSDGVS